MEAKVSINTFAVHMNAYLNGNSKRLLDIVLTICVLPIALPLIFIGVLLVGLSSKGPLFFTQSRIGQFGKEFKIYKIRTLVNAVNGDLAGMKKGDPSILPVGRWLRRWRIDELPQLVNILKGDMSWVGPRPERSHIVADYVTQSPDYSKRHEALPGITGWAQVHHPDATPNENLKKLPFDLEYVDKASVWMDVRIIWKTILAIG